MNILQELKKIESYLLKEYPVPAFHGTPHKFDKFDCYYIGTGEGHQAFGWGLYFTENETIAEEWYAKRLADNRGEIRTTDNRIIKVDYGIANTSRHLTIQIGPDYFYSLPFYMTYLAPGTQTPNSDLVPPKVKTFVDYIWNSRKKDNSKNIKLWLYGILKSDEWKMDLKASTGDKDTLKRYVDNISIKPINHPFLYEVILWPDKEPRLIDWQQSLDSDTDNAKIVFEKLMETHPEVEIGTVSWFKKKYDLGSNSLYQYWLNSGMVRNNDVIIKTETGDFPISKASQFSIWSSFCNNTLKSIFKSEKDVSMFLLSCGIDGIRYPANALSGGTGNMGWNYVVFDDSQVKIISKINLNAMGE